MQLQSKLDCPMSLNFYVCINVELEQFGFTLTRVGDSSLAHFDIVIFLKPGKYLELAQLWVCCVIFTKRDTMLSVIVVCFLLKVASGTAGGSLRLGRWGGGSGTVSFLYKIL